MKFARILFYLLFAAQPLRGLFYHVSPGTTLLLFAALPTTLFLSFIFHVDLAGINYIKPMLLRRHFEPIGDGESILDPKLAVSGGFDSHFNQYRNMLRIVFTDRRIIIRHLFSWKGLCLAEVLLADIEEIQVSQPSKYLGVVTMDILLKDDPDIQFIYLPISSPSVLVPEFRRLGVRVVEQSSRYQGPPW